MTEERYVRWTEVHVSREARSRCRARRVVWEMRRTAVWRSRWQRRGQQSAVGPSSTSADNVRSDSVLLRDRAFGAACRPGVFVVDRPATAPRSPYIRLVSSPNGSGPTASQLVGDVVRNLEPLGLIPARLTSTRGRLVDPDGRRAAISANDLDAGVQRIDVVIDSTLANDALSALRKWHFSVLGGTDRVQISARIR